MKIAALPALVAPTLLINNTMEELNQALESKTVVVLEGINALKEVMEDIYTTMSNKGGGIVRCQGLERTLYFQYFGEQYMEDFYQHIVSLKNVFYRCLVTSNDGHDQYKSLARDTFTEERTIPQEYSNFVPTFVYKDKVAHIIWSNLKVIIIKDEDLARAQKTQFDLIWNKVANTG